MEKKRALPQWYLDEPPMPDGWEFYLRAFNDLGTCRQIGMAMGPLPWDKIVDYADRMGLEADVAEDFVRCLRDMDTEYMEWERTSRPKPKTEPPPQQPGPRQRTPR